MNIQDRYTDIAKRAGLSEEIVRTVLKASRESLCDTLAQGNTATLPGICTMDVEVRTKLSKTNSIEMVEVAKVKVKPSSTMEASINNMLSSKSTTIESEDYTVKSSELTFVESKESNGSNVGIRLKQINALL